MAFEDEAKVIDIDFLDLIDGNLREKSKKIRKSFKIDVPYSSYRKQWDSLVSQLGLVEAVEKIINERMKILTVNDYDLLSKSAVTDVSITQNQIDDLWCLIDDQTHRASKLGLFILKYGKNINISFFDGMHFHPRVVKVSRSLFESAHYSQAIFEAFKCVNNYVKSRTRRTEDGRDLMAKVFNENNPVLKLNALSTQSDKDEQEGFKFLFMGAMVGIRNPKAHEDVIQQDSQRTLEYLSLASLLMRRIDESRKMRTKKVNK